MAIGRSNERPSTASDRATAVFLIGWVALVLAQEAWATVDPSKRITFLSFPQTFGGDLELVPWFTWGLFPGLVAYFRNGGVWLDRGWFGTRRWTRGDRVFLGLAAAVAVVSIGVVKAMPALSTHYRALSSYGDFGFGPRSRVFLGSLAWVLSWLPLWEFMTRGLVLPFATRAWARHGWLAVPVLETAFHLVKPWPETLGMLVFSVVATRWARDRQNLLLPFLAHLAFELTTFGYVAYG